MAAAFVVGWRLAECTTGRRSAADDSRSGRSVPRHLPGASEMSEYEKAVDLDQARQRCVSSPRRSAPSCQRSKPGAGSGQDGHPRRTFDAPSLRHVAIRDRSLGSRRWRRAVAGRAHARDTTTAHAANP